MKKRTTHQFAGYALLFLLLIVTSGTSLNAQSCTPLSGNFNLGGPAHDLGFQSRDEVNATATLSNGNFVVAWETRDGVDGNGNGAFFQVFNQSGATVTGVTMPYADVNAAGTGDQGTPGPKVIALTTGFVIAWESENGPGDTGPVGEDPQDVFFRVYNNSGLPISGATRISLPNHEDKLEYILPLSTGGFVVMTSIDEDVAGNNSDDFYFQAFNAAGVPTSGAPVNISGGAHDAAFQTTDLSHAMADLGNGNFVVAWEARENIDGEGTGAFFRVFNTNGTPVTGVVMPYADINAAGTGDQGTPGPIVLALADGKFVVSWESAKGPGDVGPGADDNKQDIYFRVYNANGTPVAGTTKANSDNTADTEELTGIIKLTGGNFAFLYRTNENAPGNNKDDYFVRTFTPAGVAAGASIEVSGGAHTEVFSAVQQYNLGFVALSNGNFAVGWAAREGADGAQSGVYYRVFNAMGGAVSPVVLPYADLNPTGIGDQSPFGPILTALPNGFSIAWNSKSGPGDVALGSADKQDVYHRVIDNNGSPLCGTTKTNAGNEDDEETLLAVQALASGNFAVVYKDEEAATGNTDDFFVRVIGGAPLQIVCPGITGTVTASGNCVARVFTLTVTGLQNMAMATNNEQNYGIKFVAFANATSNPYSGGTLLGTVPFADLTGGGTIASLLAEFYTADPDLFIYAILDATPGDAACVPAAQTVIAMNALPVVSISLPNTIYVTNGMPPLHVAGGGLPVGGEYSHFVDLFEEESIMDDGNGLTFSFLPDPPVGEEIIIEYYYVDGNGCDNAAYQTIFVVNAPANICPGIGTVTVSAPDACVGNAFDLTITGLQNMAMAANNEQNYGVKFVAFANATSNPYSGGTLLGAVPFANLTAGGTTASLTGVTVNTADPDLFIYAILDATPGDAACVPFAQTMIAINALPVVSVSLPDTIFVSNGMPPLHVAGGGLPVGGVYTDMFNEVMNDGNGETFSFLPNFFIGDVNTITYTFTDVNGCVNSASQVIFVANAPVGIDDPETLQVKVFPNPTSGIINIQGVNADRIEVMDVHGRLLSAKNHPGSIIDISNLPGGIYFLRVRVEDQMTVARIVRE